MVDDGSTDNSPAICDDFAARYDNIRVIHQENKGLSGARNAGMDVARGELITFVDSDDSLHPEMLERLFRQMEETGADISSAGTDTGKHVGGVLTPAQAITCLLKENTTFNTSAWGKLYRTKLFDGIRFPEGLVFEDYAVIPQVIHRADRIAHTDEALRTTSAALPRRPSIRHTCSILSFPNALSNFLKRIIHNSAAMQGCGKPTLPSPFSDARHSPALPAQAKNAV